MKNFSILLLLLFTNLLQAQTVLKGKVIDSKTREPLAFVSIAIKGTNLGTVSDIDGKFTLKIPASKDELLLSYVGYKPVVVQVKSDFMTIRLEENVRELFEVIVRPGVNPAWELINRAVENRAINNPERLESFSYHSYNKLYIPSKQEDSTRIKPKKPKPRTTIKVDIGGREARKKNKEYNGDSLMNEKLKNSEIFMTETYTERKFVKPNLSKEVILSTKTTGTKSVLFASIPLDVQPFGFYNDFVVMFNKNYLNPISKGSTKKYDFTLQDTLINGIDTTFVITFEPFSKKNFEGLKGFLHISNDRYAIENVVAEPVDTTLTVSFRMQQKYERVQNQWFPIQLNTDVILHLEDDYFKYVSRSYFNDIEINPTIKKNVFNYLAREIAPDANQKTEEFWQAHRIDSLSLKERNTYKLWDGMKEAKQFDKAMNVMEYLIIGEIPYKKVSFPIRHLLRLNRYEGLRLGVGLKTNELFSKAVQLEGNVAFGFFGDWALKYGAGIQFNLGNRRETRLRFTFKQDVTEPGNIDFFKLNPITERIESYRNYLTNRVDSVRQWQTEFSFRALRHGQVFFTLSNEHRNPTYAYQYLPKGDVAASQQEFTMSEVGIGIRYAYGEKYTQFGRGKAVMTSAFPVISVAVARGIPNFLGSSPDLDFTKLNIKIEGKFLWRTLGTTTFQLFAGKIWGDLPYPYLQNFRGSSSKGGIFVENYFQTMGIYEFTADQHASLFFTHNFGALLFKSKVDWFKPELMLVQNIGFGSLNNQKNHQIADLQTLDKGFYESGMVINNLWLRKFIGFKQGFGLGVFRRYGNYSLPEGIQNWSFKLTNTFSF